VIGPIAIEHPDDPRVADYRSLRRVEGRRRLEAERGVFVAEGAGPIRTLLASGRRVRSLLLLERELERLEPTLAARDVPVLVASRAVLAAIAGFDVHRGALAAADRFAPAPLAPLLAGARLLVVLEAIADGENLGAIVRSAAGLGADGVLLCPRCCDPLSRRVVRVSLGQVARLPIARVGQLPGGLEPVRAAGFRLLALTPDETAEALDGLRPTPAERIALLLGSEGPGLGARTLAAADQRVRIRLAAGVDSLNVAAAAAVALHALRR
jgi:tRNA G18 (ribose-2'-O)-methylase SpoU